MNRLNNKVVLITGGASGIGEAACRLLAKEGARVALLDINTEKGEKIVAEINSQGGQAHFWPMNTVIEHEVQTTFSQIMERWGGINVLVNNVGIIGDNKPTHELTEAEWDKVMNINVKSVLFCTKHAIPHLRKAGGGSIINMSSLHGLIGTPDYPANHASKAAIRLMTKTDAMIYAKDHIRINSIHPGYIWTPLLEEVARKSTIGYEEFISQHNKIQPIGHIGQPDDVAYAIAYLASDESRFMTASELVIDGGLSGGQLINSI